MRLITGMILATQLLASAAFASDDDQCDQGGGGSAKLQECVKAHCRAKTTCQKGILAAKAASDDAARVTGAKYQSKSEMVNPAGDIKQIEGDTAKNLQSAINTCDQQLKDECEAKCKPAGSNQKEGDQIQKELKQCRKDIAELKDPANAGKTQAEQAAKGSEDTKDKASGQGGMPPMSPPSGGDSKDQSSPLPTPTPSPSPTPSSSSSPDLSSTGSASAATTPAAAGNQTPTSNCANLDQSCLATLKDQCSKSSSDLCTSFTNRFCGLNGVSGGMEGPDGIKAGSGTGDAFCSAVTAKSYCAVGGRDSCDTCRKLKGLAPLPADQQASACGISPASLPTLQKNGSSSALGAASTGGGSSMGGGGGGSSGAAVAAGDPSKAVGENPYAKMNSALNIGADGGGGGGGGSAAAPNDGGDDNALADLASGYGIIGRGPSAAAGGAATTLSTASDVGLGGPHVFRLVDEVFRAHCATDKHNNCPPHP